MPIARQKRLVQPDDPPLVLLAELGRAREVDVADARLPAARSAGRLSSGLVGGRSKSMSMSIPPSSSAPSALARRGCGSRRRLGDGSAVRLGSRRLGASSARLGALLGGSSALVLVAHCKLSVQGTVTPRSNRSRAPVVESGGASTAVGRRR